MALPYEDSRSSPPPAGAAAASGSTGAGGFSGPFLSSLLGGSAGFGGSSEYSQNPFIRRFRMTQQMRPGASPFGRQAQPMRPGPPIMGGAGQPSTTSSASPGLLPPWARPVGSPGLGGPGTGQGEGSYKFDPNNPFAAPNPTKPLENFRQMTGWLLRQYGLGGGFDPMGDPRITAMLRQQAIQDAGAQQRSARLGLQYRNDIDPSTFGFQALMSDLGGQDRVSNAMSQAQLQQALSAQEFYRNLFRQAADADYTRERTIEVPRDDGGFDWGGALGGLGKLAGGGLLKYATGGAI